MTDTRSFAEAMNALVTSAGESAASLEPIEAGILALTELTPVKSVDRALNAAYRERAHLVALLAALFPSTWGIDPEWTDWHVVYVETPAGQLSWHISPSDRDLFAHVFGGTADAVWDGHSTEEKYERIRKLTADKATAPLPPFPDQDRTEWGVKFTDPHSGVPAVGNYGPAEEYARRMAAISPAHSTVLHRRAIRRQDSFGEWIEDASPEQ